MEGSFSVSVCMISYQHEPFIVKAIEGVLKQKTSFPFNIVIGDDCSTDNTVNSIKTFSWEENNNITILTSDCNVGMMPNFMRTLTACSGKYIAICEGDDYWTDEYKLQKQFDFMEQNQDYAMCFHNATIINQVNQTSKLFGIYNRTEYYGKDLLNMWLIPTASIFFKNVLPKNYPAFFSNATHGDLALFMYLADFGKIKYIDEIMSVYRINAIGITQISFKGIKHNVAHVAQLELMLTYFGEKYKFELKQRIANYLISTGYLYAKEGEKKIALKYFLKAMKISKFEILKRMKYVFGTIYYIVKP